MSSRLEDMFLDEELVERVKVRLPVLFQLAEMECSRAGKIGMEVGSVREKIIAALLIYKFGEENVDTKDPITEPEIDVRLSGNPISIKTITGKTFSGVKLIWTVDAEKAREFGKNYAPLCDMVLAQINWGGSGGLFYLPLQAQKRIFEEIGRDAYLKLPKPGTNPRGVEITRNALSRLARHQMAKVIRIQWEKGEFDFDPYSRWIDYWRDKDSEIF